jgi:hypothetical protein
VFPWYVGLYGLFGALVGVIMLVAGSPSQLATIGQKLREASDDGDGNGDD